jgi:hypothetical protein
MCRSIKKLRLPAGVASPEEVEAAALQYVRKVSGFRAPSRANSAAFARAVERISAVTGDLLEALDKNRATRARSAQ